MGFSVRSGSTVAGAGLVLMLVVFHGIAGAVGYAFPGGEGSSGAPWHITDWDDLNGIRDYVGDSHGDKHFKLMNDLDENTEGYDDYNSGEGWDPIGDFGDPFTGTFDGRGYEISDLFINRTSTNRIGLFGDVGDGGIVKNVGLIDVEIINGSNGVGGLVGSNRGTVSDSYAIGSVAGEENVGGLVGANLGTVSDSYVTGSVTGGDNVGGLVGSNDGKVSNSCFTGNVDGAYNVGGLAGFNNEAITNSYVTGSVTGGDNVGGLVGFNGFPGMITNSYFTGSIDGDYDVGGLVGNNAGTVSDSFYDEETSDMSDTCKGEPKTTDEMQTKSTFTDAGWDFEDIWDINALNDGYPFLRWQVSPDPEPEDDDDADAPRRRRPSPSPAPEPEPAHPAPPAGFTVEPRDGFILSNHVVWMESGSGPVSSYRLYVSTGGSTGAMGEGGAEGFEFWLLGEFSPDTFEYTHTGLSGIRYYYVITSVNEEGLESNVTSPVYWANPATGEYGWLDALAWPGNIVEKPEDGGSSCFIATAAYGSPLSLEVTALRAFRDGFLLTSRAGRELTSAYYRMSPGLAEIIEGNRMARFALRLNLAPFVKAAGALTGMN